MGFMDYWSCIDENFQIKDFLLEIGEKGNSLSGKSGNEKDEQGRLKRGETVFGKTFPHTNLRGMIVLVNDYDADSGDTFYNIKTAYPTATLGIIHDVTLDEVISGEEDFEGLLTVGFKDGPLLTFFDSLYFKHKNSYRLGQVYTFALSGLAYKLEVAEPQMVELGESEGGRVLQKIMEEEGIGDKGPIKLSTAGMAAITPIENYESYYNVYGPVKEVTSFRMQAYTIYQLQMTVARKVDEGGGDIDLLIYAPESAFKKGRIPKKGNDLFGLIWLQGFLVLS